MRFNKLLLVSALVSPLLLTRVSTAQESSTSETVIAETQVVEPVIAEPVTSESIIEPTEVVPSDSYNEEEVINNLISENDERARQAEQEMSSVLNEAGRSGNETGVSDPSSSESSSSKSEDKDKKDESKKRTEEEMKREAERMAANHSAPPYIDYESLYFGGTFGTPKFVNDNLDTITKFAKDNKIKKSIVLGVIISERNRVGSDNFDLKKTLNEFKKHYKTFRFNKSSKHDFIVEKLSAKYSGLAYTISFENLLSYDNGGNYHAKIEQLISTGFSYTGVPYVWGGKTPYGFDCSGFVSWVYAEALGIHVPAYTVSAEPYGYEVPLSELQVGDLLFFGDRGQTDHIAIYIGNGEYIHSSTINGGVGVYNLRDYSPHFARRIIVE